jgi:addiction module HigA family antidote
MADTANWHPEWVVAPGEVLVEALEERGMTQAELGRRMARPLKTISEIATGKAAITPETAIQLERTLGISAAVWLGLETRYREAQARALDRAELEGQASWLKRFPLRELVKRGIISAKSAAAQQAAELLAFFGVSNPTGWEQHWGRIAASYRLTGRGKVSKGRQRVSSCRPLASHAFVLLFHRCGLYPAPWCSLGQSSKRGKSLRTPALGFY